LFRARPAGLKISRGWGWNINIKILLNKINTTLIHKSYDEFNCKFNYVCKINLTPSALPFFPLVLPGVAGQLLPTGGEGKKIVDSFFSIFFGIFHDIELRSEAAASSSLRFELAFKFVLMAYSELAFPVVPNYTNTFLTSNIY
jgi:hypothetical protein